MLREKKEVSFTFSNPAAVMLVMVTVHMTIYDVKKKQIIGPPPMFNFRLFPMLYLKKGTVTRVAKCCVVEAEVTTELRMAEGQAVWPRSIGLRSLTYDEYLEALGKRSRGPKIWILVGWSLFLGGPPPTALRGQLMTSDLRPRG